MRSDHINTDSADTKRNPTACRSHAFGHSLKAREMPLVQRFRTQQA